MTGKSILIVEDENIIALEMRMRLQAMGYRVLDVVDSGDAALERTITLQPDLVLMDIRLKGGKDGIDAALELRERTEVPVIFVTAYTDEKTLERAKGASPYGYIVKPFHERELRIAIELALYKNQYELSIRRAKDLAETANRLKSEFLANMSHELKTPLNSAMGFIQLAMEKAVDAEQGELLAMALRSSKSLLTLIDSILDFTKMEAGRMKLAPAPFSLDDVIGDCLDALAVEAYPKGLEVSFKRDASLPDALIGDSGLLRHVLLNLLDNAAKFTDSGVVGLSVAAARDEGGLGGDRDLELVFAVADTGIGMPCDKIGAAFERFTQLDASMTRRAGGTGLGLAIVNRSVELLGGSVHVESEPGKGTRIEFRVPFSTDPDAEPPTPSPLAGRSVLVAGFEGRFASEIGEVVSSMGASVSYSDDVAGAMEGELVLADERTFSEKGASSIHDGLAGRLIVATRFGSVLRSRLATCSGVAFVPLPARADRLAVAVKSLCSPIAASGAAVPRRTVLRKSASTRQGDAGILSSLSERIERAVGDARFDLAESAIKKIRDELAEAGDDEGARLAFSALLLSRKGDAEGMRRLAERVRAAATAEREDEQD